MSNSEALNIITIKTGKRYPAEYANKMASMIKRHLSIPHTFYCLTEDPSCLSEDIQVITPPEVLHGWWNKLYVFSDLMPKGKILYLDLDQVITGDITEIVQECLKHEFSCYSDHIHWLDCKFGSSFMVFESGAHKDIFKAFWKQLHELADFTGGDQVWLGQCGLLPEVFYLDEFFEKDTIQSYKFDYLARGLAESTRIVNAHGLPKPHHIRLSKFIKEHWR